MGCRHACWHRRGVSGTPRTLKIGSFEEINLHFSTRLIGWQRVPAEHVSACVIELSFHFPSRRRPREKGFDVTAYRVEFLSAEAIFVFVSFFKAPVLFFFESASVWSLFRKKKQK